MKIDKHKQPTQTLDQHEFRLNSFLEKSMYYEWSVAFCECLFDGYLVNLINTKKQKQEAEKQQQHIEIIDDVNALKLVFDENLFAHVIEN